MRFYKGATNFCFMYSECPAGANCAEAEDVEHEVEITFTQREWSEPRPYGSTYAMETLCELEDGSEHYTLDGEEVSLEDLQERFGKEWINSKLEVAQNHADLTELRDEVDYDPFD